MRKISFFIVLLCSLSNLSFGQTTISGDATCMVDTLNISTGYVPLGDSVNHQNESIDAHWKIGVCANTPIIPALNTPATILIPVTTMVFPTQLTSSWVSIGNMAAAAYYANNHSIEYYIKLERTFELCKEDSIVLDMQSVCRDNWIDTIYIDDIALPYHDPTPYSTSNYYTFQALGKFDLGLLNEGTHKLTFKINNQSHDVFTENFHGLNMYAKIFSKTASKPFRSESASCIDYKCPVNNDTTTYIGNLHKKNETGLYFAPNPAKNQVSVSWSNVSARYNAEIRLYDMLGKNIANFPINIKSKVNEQLIDLSQFMPGLYNCNLVVDGVNMVSKKLVLSN